MVEVSKFNKHLFQASLGIGGVVLAERVYEKVYHQKNFLLKSPSNEHSLANFPMIQDISWLKEENYENQVREIVYPSFQQHLISGTFNHDNLEFFYDYYQVENPKASLVIVHGFNEYKEKFSEFIYYLLQQQVEVFVFDQRGHGFSKATETSTRVDIDDFYTYVSDLEAFIEQVVEPRSQSDHKVLFGHSMGGAIVTLFNQLHPDYFDKLILNAPMLAIETGKVSAPMAHLYANIATSLNQGHHHLPTTEKFDDIASRKFPEKSTVFKNTERARFYHELNFEIHRYPTRGGSINWLKASLDATNAMTRPQNLRKIKADTLIIRAENDKIVNKAGLFNAQEFIPSVTNVYLPHGDHEMSCEHDDNIQLYYSCLLDFILH